MTSTSLTPEAREELLEGVRNSRYWAALEQFTVEYTDDGIILGAVEVVPGENAAKPVIRDAKSKSLMAGSGRYPRNQRETPLQQAVGIRESTGYRNSVDYRGAFERLFPAGGDPDERGSLAWLFDQFWSAVEGSPQYVACPHEECSKKHLVAFKKDAPSMFKMIELGVGKAAQTVNINSKEERLTVLLEQRTMDIHVFGIDPAGMEARREIIEEAGFVLPERGA